MIMDTRIIQQHSDYVVLAETVAVHWPDGSTIGLHPVRLRGRDARYLRALQYDRLLWLVVDVCGLAPSLAAEIPALPWSDTEDLVRLTLRLRYAHADALRARAVTTCRARWTDMPGTPSARPKALPASRALDAACWQRSGTAVLGAMA